ncbi:MAG TPA: extracellular solute-binding protein [Candidatus Baltobacteraceae bacterium]|nr:extracellular solute-binding protein [Candidatus Baltobacteraceae bacterium]
MHKLAFARLSALVLAVALIGATASSAAAVVDVLYAASLVTPMNGPVADALRANGTQFNGEPGGSKKLANLIASGFRSPDVFISVDPAIVEGLGTAVGSSTTFAHTSLGVAWSPKSKFHALLESAAAGKVPLLDALLTPGLRIGRTDPQLDPKGQYTIQALRAIAGPTGERKLLGEDKNPAQIFPEEDLLARVETGEVDAGFFYRTEAVARGYPFVPLPPSPASQVTYVLAVMKNAPHPEAARTFATFILQGNGRDILEKAGLEYVIPRGNQ